MEDKWLFPLSILLLAGTLAALGWRARARRGHGPLLLGSIAALIVLVAKFEFNSAAIVYWGAGLLFLACIWNIWPFRGRLSKKMGVVSLKRETNFCEWASSSLHVAQKGESHESDNS